MFSWRLAILEEGVISTEMRIPSLSLFTLPYFIRPVVSENCSLTMFHWKGRDVEFMDHCDIMKDKMTVHLDRLTARFDCLTNVTVVLGNTEMNDTTIRHVMHLAISGRDKTVTFKNPLLTNMKCKPIGVSLKTEVFFS